MMKKFTDILILLLILGAIGAAFYFVGVSFHSPEEVREYVRGWGAWGPMIVIVLIILEVVLAPIPGYVIAVGAGATFGPWLGFTITYIGNVIGTFLAFWISRHFGRPIVQRLVKEDHLKRYDRFFRERGVIGLWIAYALPVFPVDIISFVTGFSGIRFRKFAVIVLVAFIPNMLFLNFFGDRIINSGLGAGTIIFGSVIILLATFGYAWTMKYKKS